MRVGLLLKRGKTEAAEIARALCRWLVERGHQAVLVGEAPPDVCTEASQRIDESVCARVIDLLCVLGGDGTLLHGAELVSDAGVPILGINLGNLGFLTSSLPAEATEVIALAIDGRLPLERRMRLRVVLERGAPLVDLSEPSKNVEAHPIVRYACNDVVISQGALARLLEIEARLDGRSITTYRADGLIVSTPTGSTAYTLSAGGPIVMPDVEAMVLTPICPHTLTNRALVVPSASRLVLRLAAEAREVVLTVDGQWGTPLRPGDRVEIHAANRPMLLYRPPELTYFEILRSKLGWGERTRSGG